MEYVAKSLDTFVAVAESARAVFEGTYMLIFSIEVSIVTESLEFGSSVAQAVEY